MRDFDNDVAAGSIFRKVVCERCGAENYEKFLGFNGEGWESYPSYEGAGFGGKRSGGRGHRHRPDADRHALETGGGAGAA